MAFEQGEWNEISVLVSFGGSYYPINLSFVWPEIISSSHKYSNKQERLLEIFFHGNSALWTILKQWRKGNIYWHITNYSLSTLVLQNISHWVTGQNQCHHSQYMCLLLLPATTEYCYVKLPNCSETICSDLFCHRSKKVSVIL